MLVTAVTQLVGLCSRYAWAVVIAAAVIAGGSAVYAAKRFAITTDINNLLAPNLEWRKRERAFETAFPGPVSSILIVVDAPTPELVAEASSLLANKLEQQILLFKSVRPLDGDPFFAKNGLLFQSEADLGRITRGLGAAGPIIGVLAADPSLRGLTRGLSFGLLGVQSGGAKLDDMVRPLSMAADTIDQVLADLVIRLTDHRSGRRHDPSALGAELFHRRDRLFDHAGQRAPPSGVRGTDYPRLGIGQQHRSAVGG